MATTPAPRTQPETWFGSSELDIDVISDEDAASEILAIIEAVAALDDTEKNR